MNQNFLILNKVWNTDIQNIQKTADCWNLFHSLPVVLQIHWFPMSRRYSFVYFTINVFTTSKYKVILLFKRRQFFGISSKLLVQIADPIQFTLWFHIVLPVFAIPIKFNNWIIWILDKNIQISNFVKIHTNNFNYFSTFHLKCIQICKTILQSARPCAFVVSFDS